ncbi:MAG: response regulator transcription factor [Thermomicrobiales bacterium]
MLQVGMTALYEMLVLALAYKADQIESRHRLAMEGGKAWNQALGVVTESSPRFAALPLLVIEGDWGEAHAVASAALTNDMAVLRNVIMALLGPLARHRGESELAWEQIRELFPEGPAISPGTLPFYPSLVLQRLAAALATDTGDLALAQQWLTTHDTFMQWGGAVLGQAEGHLGWAAYYRASGDVGRAYECATAAFNHAVEPRQPLALLAAHRCLGELEIDRGCFDTAEAHLRASLALADACATPYERAQTLMGMAELAHARGDNTNAFHLLSEVRTICTPLGAKPLLARVTALAAKLGTVAPLVSAVPGGLTAREVEVLRLAAQGLSNAEIAAHLFLSAHTVHRHMANILTKLDLPSRVAAVAYALRHGIL